MIATQKEIRDSLVEHYGNPSEFERVKIGETYPKNDNYFTEIDGKPRLVKVISPAHEQKYAAQINVARMLRLEGLPTPNLIRSNDGLD